MILCKSKRSKDFFYSLKNGIFLFLFILTLTSPAFGKTSFSSDAQYDVCFTPGDDCTALIVQTLDQAKEQIQVQAYSFTSAPIAKALLEAKKRGIDVKVILDKSQLSERYTIARYLLNHQIPVWIDSKPAIAHNKVMIIDNRTTITGSFNFTKAAQNRNAENVLVIEDSKLAKYYKMAWDKRQKVSKTLES